MDHKDAIHQVKIQAMEHEQRIVALEKHQDYQNDVLKRLEKKIDSLLASVLIALVTFTLGVIGAMLSVYM